MSHEHVRLDSVMEAMSDGAPKYYDALHPPTAVADPFAPGTQMVELHSYSDVKRVLEDPNAYSKQLIPLEYKESVPIEMGHWAQDQPQNRELKRLTMPHFTARALRERLVGTVNAEVDRCVDGIIQSGQETIAYDRTFGRIPRRVMAKYIGVDPDDPVLDAWIPEVNSLATMPERPADTRYL